MASRSSFIVGSCMKTCCISLAMRISNFFRVVDLTTLLMSGNFTIPFNLISFQN